MTLFMLVALLGEVVEGLEVTKVALKLWEPAWEGILTHKAGVTLVLSVFPCPK